MNGSSKSAHRKVRMGARRQLQEGGGAWRLLDGGACDPRTASPPAHPPPGDPPVLVVRAGLGGAVLRAVVHVEGAVALTALAGDRQQHGAAVLQAVVEAGLEEDAAGRRRPRPRQGRRPGVPLPPSVHTACLRSTLRRSSAAWPGCSRRLRLFCWWSSA